MTTPRRIALFVLIALRFWQERRSFENVLVCCWFYQKKVMIIVQSQIEIKEF